MLEPQVVVGTDGDDLLFAPSGMSIIVGQDGVDTVRFFFPSEQYDISVFDEGGPSVYWYLGGSTHTSSVERLQFSDGILAVSPEAFQVYRLYQAALNREPDIEGVSFWINHADRGLGLQELASYFIQSDEFISAYGRSPSNEEYVDLLYWNVLRREPDQGGYDYWTDRMDDGLTYEDMLIEFSESVENKALTVDAITDGIWII